MTLLNKFPLVRPGQFQGRNIKYGEREFGMATMATGLYKTAFIIPYIGTYLTFSDYMRNAIRLAALQHSQVIYQFTHDSIFLGEDGPTHQPVEHFASLRAIPSCKSSALPIAMRYVWPGWLRCNLKALQQFYYLVKIFAIWKVTHVPFCRRFG